MVSTSRFRWMLGVSISIAIIGVLARQEPMLLIGLMICVWGFFEWLRFRCAMLFSKRALENGLRRIVGLEEHAATLNIDETYLVEIGVTVPRLAGGNRFWINDVVPAHCQTEDGSTRFISDVSSGERIHWRYQICPTIVGRLYLSGLQVVMTDKRGLFRWQSFVPLGRDLKVLPFVARPQATVSVLKKNNIQILNGTHRYRRPGFSSELLGIREYQAGDPPRSIAWKATARLGKLMTCEYESEVPVRANMICDLSDYQYVGRPGRAAADRVVSAAASVAKLLLADRDPVGATLVAGSQVVTLGQGHGERQLTRILQSMLDYCDRQQVHADIDSSTLLRLAWVGCYQRFPELFDDRVNRVRPRLFPLAQDLHLQVTQGEQLSFALATLYNMQPGYAERIQYDEVEFRELLKRFMRDYPIRQTLARRAFDARRLSDSERTTFTSIVQCLMERVSRAKDNELFVVIGVAPLEASELERLTSTIRLARARHHRVVMLEVEPPPADDKHLDFRASRILATTRSTQKVDRQSELREQLNKLGAKVASVSDPKLVEFVAKEVELLRSGRTRGRISGVSR